MSVRKLICVLFVLVFSLSSWAPVQALSLDGNCSNWKVGTLTDSSGKNQETRAKALCANLGKSGDSITVFDPRNQTCLLCSRADWTPGSSSSFDNGTKGKEENVALGKNASSKPACHLRTGYLFKSTADTEFNVLKERNPKENEYYWHYYTVANPMSERWLRRGYSIDRDIKYARKEAQRIVAEGYRDDRKYDFVLRGSLDEFCSYLKKECDIENSVLKYLYKACGWGK